MGCDLAYVFCASSAAPVIKSYSPELIVIPALQESVELKQVRRICYMHASGMHPASSTEHPASGIQHPACIQPESVAMQLQDAAVAAS